jgi:hypothetical protein
MYEVFDLEPEKPETIAGTAVRGIARTGARAVESILGLPGDIIAGARGLITSAGESLKQSLESKLGQQLPGPTEQPEAVKTPFGEIPVPTSKLVREKVTEPIAEKILPKDYLKPVGKYERLSDRIISDVAPLIVGGVSKLGALTIGGLSNLGSFAAKELGFGGKAQEGIKLGTMLITSFATPRLLKNYAKTLPSAQAVKFRKQVDGASKINNFVKKYLTPKNNPLTLLTLGGLGSHFMGLKPLIGAAVGAAKGVYLAGLAEKSLRMLSKNPSLRKYYKNIMIAAAKQKGPTVIKNIANFDKIIKKGIGAKGVGMYEVFDFNQNA